MSIETALHTAIQTIPDCVAAGYVDMETGMLLGTDAVDDQSAGVLDTLALAVANLFQGRGVSAFEQLLRETGANEDEHPGFGEIAVFANDHLHIFLRMQDYPDHVVCYICRDSANIGLALTKSHLSLKSVSAAV